MHVVELIVSDGFDDSVPDEVVITVFGPIKAYLRILPRTINYQSQAKNVSAHIRLPAGISKYQIDPDERLLLYPGEIRATDLHLTQSHRQGDIHATIFASFDKAGLMGAVSDDGPTELQIIGQLKSGQYFYASDTVTVIHKR